MRKSFSLLLVLFVSTSWAFALEVPKHSGLVVDLANIFSAKEQRTIEHQLRNVQKQTSAQVQLLTIPSLEGEVIEDYSIRVVDQWKLGDKIKDNGVLLLIALQDRKLRIEVGQGLEGDLTDALANRIIQRIIVPYFKQGEYKRGTIKGLEAITLVVGGNLDAVKYPRERRYRKRSGYSLFSSIISLLFILLCISGRMGLLPAILLSSSLGRPSGFGGSGGFGGGFGGGGGGGFSGGGASGGW